MKVRRFFKDLETAREEHPVDKLVNERVGVLSAERRVAKVVEAIVHALGESKRLWFDYEQARDGLNGARDEAYFDIGVEYGIAIAHADELADTRWSVKRLAQHLLREAMASGLARKDAAAAATLAAWSLLGRLRSTRHRGR